MNSIKLGVIMSRNYLKISMALYILGFSCLGYSAHVVCNVDAINGMHVAIVNYMEQDANGAFKGVTIDSERCLSSYASALVHYNRPDYDDQVAYLHFDRNGWVVLGVATGFDEAFMNRIPEPLHQ
jgi:hypothetical protein